MWERSWQRSFELICRLFFWSRHQIMKVAHLSCDPSCASTSNWFLKLLNRSQLLSATKCRQLKAKSIFSPNKNQSSALSLEKALCRSLSAKKSVWSLRPILGAGCWKLSLKEILTWLIYILQGAFWLEYISRGAFWVSACLPAIIYHLALLFVESEFRFCTVSTTLR